MITRARNIGASRLLRLAGKRFTATVSASTPLEPIIEDTIKTIGPISLSKFMRTCLTHPEHGYYIHKDPLDADSGDFITAPEMSVAYGMTCGLAFVRMFLAQLQYQSRHSPDFKVNDKVFRVIEFGPGKGSMMRGLAMVFKQYIIDNPVEIVMVEKSDILIKEQHKLLCKAQELQQIDDYNFKSVTEWGQPITWQKNDLVELDLDHKYMNFVVAHEFFDALPIDRYIKTKHGWREYLVDVRRPEAGRPGKFGLVVAPHATPGSFIPATNERYNKLAVGANVEISADAHMYASQFAKIINSGDVGGALIIDYGPKDTIPINSLRGIKDHKFVDPFSEPGKIDLSVDVDFLELSRLFESQGLKTVIETQSHFLNSSGLPSILGGLAFSMKEHQQRFETLYQRLTGSAPQDMGRAYKALQVYKNANKTT
ncbi:hypothetical protein KL919_004070 [Ogataea angusta]|nr:hypothetical protein KL943_000232 [Ogataea angusta]KAG7856540.1 hypothetical protein KL919_004070 [Ogataea angusta]